MEAALIGQNTRYIDSDGLVWNSVKYNDTWLLAALKSKALAYDSYLKRFIAFIIFLGLIIGAAYIWSEKKEDFYLSIRMLVEF